jgi:hypothetical protein
VQLHADLMHFAKQVEQVLYSERRRIPQGVIDDHDYRLAWLEGAAAAIFGVARQAVDGGRDLSDRERDFILSCLDT